MIDLEFAFMGPCAFDVGMFLANLIFTYYQHMSIPQDNDVHRQYSYRIIDLCKKFGKSLTDLQFFIIIMLVLIILAQRNISTILTL